MSPIASQITIVYSTVYSGADQRKHQSSASLAFVRRIHRSPQKASKAENVSIWWRHHVLDAMSLPQLMLIHWQLNHKKFHRKFNVVFILSSIPLRQKCVKKWAHGDIRDPSYSRENNLGRRYWQLWCTGIRIVEIAIDRNSTSPELSNHLSNSSPDKSCNKKNQPFHHATYRY